MKKIFFINTLAILLLLVIFSPLLASVSYAEPKLANPLKYNDIKTVLLFFLDNVIIRIGTIIAIMWLIYAGYLFVSAGGDTGKIKEAKTHFFNVIIGIAILLGAKAIALVVKNTITVVGGNVNPF